MFLPSFFCCQSVVSDIHFLLSVFSVFAFCFLLSLSVEHVLPSFFFMLMYVQCFCYPSSVISVSRVSSICDKIWQRGEWPTRWTQSLVITLPKKGNLRQCQNYRTISLGLISHPSKVMLKIILYKLKPQAEKIIAEEQAGFRAGRRTTEQIFNPYPSRRPSPGLAWWSYLDLY